MFSNEHEPDSLIVRVFPIPGVLMFPRTLLPLHIFEPRYRQLMADALETDRQMAIVMPVTHQIKTNPDGFLASDSPLHSIGCVGSIHQETKLPDGRYHFVLHGQFRIELLEEMDVATPYRQFRACQIAEQPAKPAPANQLRRAELISLLGVMIGHEQGGPEMLKFLANEADDEWFANLAPFSAPIYPEEKQLLLNFGDHNTRLNHLVENLITLTKDKRRLNRLGTNGSLN